MLGSAPVGRWARIYAPGRDMGTPRGRERERGEIVRSRTPVALVRNARALIRRQTGGAFMASRLVAMEKPVAGRRRSAAGPRRSESGRVSGGRIGPRHPGPGRTTASARRRRYCTAGTGIGDTEAEAATAMAAPRSTARTSGCEDAPGVYPFARPLLWRRLQCLLPSPGCGPIGPRHRIGAAGRDARGQAPAGRYVALAQRHCDDRAARRRANPPSAICLRPSAVLAATSSRQAPRPAPSDLR
jgi:hypothetical protein